MTTAKFKGRAMPLVDRLRALHGDIEQLSFEGIGIEVRPLLDEAASLVNRAKIATVAALEICKGKEFTP